MTTSQTTGSGPRRPRRRKVLLGVLAAVALMVGYVGVTFVEVWQASRDDGARQAEAIVVLGAAQYDGTPSPALRARLEHALELYEQGLAPMIVVTGGRQEGDRFTEATSGYNYLRDRGVPDDAILKEVKGASTYESMAAASRLLGADGITDVVLVSSPAHAKRLAGIAGDVGLKAVISPTDTQPGIREYSRETVGVALGRVVGYRRLTNFLA